MATDTIGIELVWEVEPPPGLDVAQVERALGVFRVALGAAGRDLSVLMAGDEVLSELNATWRGKQGPTDVLSWGYEDQPGAPWGDLALSLERTAAQAAENGWDITTEALRLLAHGCAHLAGHDHQTPDEERVMRALEIQLLEKVGVKGLYP